MRTKWQSSLTFGDKVKIDLKGNCLWWRHRVSIWENLLDLSRSLNLLDGHSFVHKLHGNERIFKAVQYMDQKIKSSIKFSLTIAVITFVLAAIFSSFSSSLLNNVSWIIGLVIVLLIVLIGIIFDMLGIASTAAKEAPLHAMAAEKVTGAKEAVNIYKNADKFASFCNDVIGDISGIISGSALTIVILDISRLIQGTADPSPQLFLSVFLTSLIAALTVGGKALGKYFAIHSSTKIILLAGKIIYFLQDKLKIKVLPKSNKK